jgi:hypothetical protein
MIGRVLRKHPLGTAKSTKGGTILMEYSEVKGRVGRIQEVVRRTECLKMVGTMGSSGSSRNRTLLFGNH